MSVNYIPQYSLKHTAHMVHMSDRTIRRWIKAGKIDGYRIGFRKSWYIGLPEINRVREVHGLPPLSVDESIAIFEQY